MNKKRKLLISLLPFLLFGIAGASLGTVAWFEATRNIIAGDSETSLDVKPSAVDLGDIHLYLVVDEDTSRTTMTPIELTDNNGDRWAVIKNSDKYYYQKISTTKAEGVTFGKLGLKVVAKKGIPEQDVTLNDLKPYDGTTLTYNITPGERTRIALTNDSAVYAVAAETANFAFTVTINAKDSLSYTIKNPSSVVQDTIYYSVAGKFKGSTAEPPEEGEECPSTDVDQAGKGEGIGHVYINGQKNNATMKFGEYPQTVVNEVEEPELFTELSKITTRNAKGYFEYNGNQYEQIWASPLNQSWTNYFEDGSEVVIGKMYFFKVEPIVWKIISADGKNLFLTTDKCIDRQAFDYNNNLYNESYIRSWLNGESPYSFFGKAFSEPETQLINITKVDNSILSTTDKSNPYCTEDTFDKVFLLSTAELFDSKTFGSSTTTHSRDCYPTDYALAKGVYVYQPSPCYYWSRTTSTYSAATKDIICSTSYSTFYSNNYSVGVRPAINLKLTAN